MSFIYINSKSNNQSHIDSLIKQKLLNRIYYNKALIRSPLLTHKKLKVIDSYSAISILENSFLLKNKEEVKLGSSVSVNTITYSSNLNNSVKFKLNSNAFIGSNFELLESFEKSIENLNEHENKLKNILILNPIKGGFNCYSSGLFGFLPRGHANIFFYDLALSFIKQYKKSTHIGVLNYFRCKSFIEKKFIFRFPLYLGKISMYTQYKRNNFSVTKRIKKRVFNNRLNIVFLSQLEELENFKNIIKNEKN
jgi:hypothetical protein